MVKKTTKIFPEKNTVYNEATYKLTQAIDHLQNMIKHQYFIITKLRALISD